MCIRDRYQRRVHGDIACEMKSYRANGGRQGQQLHPAMRMEPEITPKVGSRPVDGNSMPVKFGKGDAFSGSNYKLEEEKYRSVPTKANTQRTTAQKPPAKKSVRPTNDMNMLMGGGGFGARPQLSSQKKKAVGTKSAAKVAVKAGKPSAAQRGAPFSGSRAGEVPIKRGYGKGLGISEFADSGPIGQCKYCQRTFNEEALARHVNVCLEKPGRRKRKVFDSSKKRIVDNEQKSLQKMGSKFAPKKEPPSKMPKWKAMSLEFRHGLKAARLAKRGIKVPAFKNPMGDAVSASFTKCPTCGRSFNDTAARRHIPFCANKTKEEALRMGGKPRGKMQTKPVNKATRRKCRIKLLCLIRNAYLVHGFNT
eukprot:TRINITY_DN692_c0_g1_i16.p1 TRINITY_DN692_c0_g1~~TRINITY_DN692_c0_g1_i16.p1  ORF type:complete len:380 (-),score=71.53 TRINITY_DN692_c0_g1_i16:163-1257(-)